MYGKLKRVYQLKVLHSRFRAPNPGQIFHGILKCAYNDPLMLIEIVAYEVVTVCFFSRHL